MFKKEGLQHAREIIDDLVQIVPERPATWNPVNFRQKLDRLSEVIDALRFDAGSQEEEDQRKTFRPNSLVADVLGKRLHFAGNGEGRRADYKRASDLIVPLLDYLYTHPGKGKAVLSIIRSFVKEYLPNCHMVDFQRTGTGVLRIETNVRFAAHELRKFGLLQFTQAEAFKTWRLSLFGIIAASTFTETSTEAKDGFPPVFWLGTILARLALVNNFETIIYKLENYSKRTPFDWSQRKAFLNLTMESVTEYRKVLSADRPNNAGARSLHLQEILRGLSSSPEAAFFVDAFDGALPDQLNLDLPPGTKVA